MIIPPNSGDCAPAIQACMASGQLPEFGPGDYGISQLVWPPALPGHPQPCWAIKGAGHDITRFHCLSSGPSVFTVGNLGIAPRGIRLEGFTVYADGHTPGALCDLAGQAPDATVALTFPIVMDIMGLGFGSAPVVKIQNAMAAVLEDVVGEGCGPSVDILDCGQITVNRAQAIGGTGPGFRVKGTFGSHFAEGAIFTSCWGNGQTEGWDISNWSDFRAQGCDISSASGLALRISGYWTDFKFSDCDFNSTNQTAQIDPNTGGPEGNDLEFSDCDFYAIAGGNYGIALNGRRIRLIGGTFHDYTNVDIFVQNCQDYEIIGVQTSSPNTNAPGQCSIWEEASMGASNGKIALCGTRNLVHASDPKTIAQLEGNYRIA